MSLFTYWNEYKRLFFVFQFAFQQPPSCILRPYDRCPTRFDGYLSYYWRIGVWLWIRYSKIGSMASFDSKVSFVTGHAVIYQHNKTREECNKLCSCQSTWPDTYGLQRCSVGPSGTTVLLEHWHLFFNPVKCNKYCMILVV